MEKHQQPKNCASSSCQDMLVAAIHRLQELSHLEGHGRNICQEDCVEGLSYSNVVCCPQCAVAQLVKCESGITPNALVDLLTKMIIRSAQDQCGQDAAAIVPGSSEMIYKCSHSIIVVK